MDDLNNRSELFTALAKAQSEMKGAIKDGNNPHFKSQYATLASTWEACRDALTKNGLSIIQRIKEQDRLYIETILAHSSGQWISSECPILMGRQDMQALGSAITYARRYSLMSLVGIAPEDDDGNAACIPTIPDEQPKQKAQINNIEFI